MAKNNDVGKIHQSRIKRQAIKNPIESYFLGGFNLLPIATQQEVLKELDNMGKK
tara:strand:+ start:59 stop:220 length:162 start_codon:yes stop_codon:yes gene_type:complete